MTKRAFSAVFLLLASPLMADPEIRQHFGLMAHGDRFSITRIDRAGEIQSTYTVLITDELTQNLYRLVATRNYQAQTFDFQLTDLQSPRNFISTKFKMTLRSKTRSESRAELRSSAAQHSPVQVTLSTHGASVTKSEMEWRTADAAASKSVLTSTLPGDFKLVIDKLQRVAVVPQMFDFCADFLAYFASTPDCRPKSGVQLVTLLPDCSFDQKHGEPCSTSQHASAGRALRGGKGRYY